MVRSKQISTLTGDGPVILPSMLLCDFRELGQEVRRLEAAGFPGLHLDVMDGNFVPNLTYGMPIVEAVRRTTDLPLDVHLMIDAPERYVPQFVEAGANMITIHAEATKHPREVLKAIRELGVAAGIAINPKTSVSTIAECAGYCDLVLIMSVEAGFGGQAFDPGAPFRLKEARQIFGDNVILEVDGGVSRETIGACVEAGAQWCVVGSAIFRQSDYGTARSELRRVLELHVSG